MRKLLLLFLSVLALLSYGVSARADTTTPGSLCTEAGVIKQTGGPEKMPGQELICDGAVWQLLTEKHTDGSVLHQIGYDSGSCTLEKAGRLRFSSSGVWEYCKGSDPWVSF